LIAIVRSIPGPNPLINLVALEFPKTTNAVGGKTLVSNPGVVGIALHSEIGRDLVNGEPSVFHALSFSRSAAQD
jgi:hypothetical protein